jgi:phosphopantetheine--protein transferase-like protein
MEAATLLRKTVAEFFEVDEGQVGPSFSLQARQGSIARAALDAAIRGRVGVKSIAVYSARTFGELEAEIAPGSAGSPPPASSPIPAPVVPASAPIAGASGASCGVDLELIANLPVAVDPWEHEFYRGNFTPSEIAYCLRQPEPATHFAARWCAKEALKKCDRAFLAVPLNEIEVVLDEAGAPRLEYLGGGPSRRLPHAVSLSHTLHAAVAMVVRVDPAPPLPPDPVPAMAIASPPAPVAPADAPRRRGATLLVALNLLAIVLAALALARTFPGFRWPFAG